MIVYSYVTFSHNYIVNTSYINVSVKILFAKIKFIHIKLKMLKKII